MRRPLSRTSITEDEAVSILLGQTTGPIEFKSNDRAEDPEEFESIDEAEEAEANRPMFDLRETLEDELEVLDGEYRRAIEKQPAHVIAEKLAALRRHEEMIERANVHLAAVRDELNKGERSMLRVDRELSNAAYTFVTLHSFNEWVKHRQSPAGGQPDGAEATDADRVPAKKEKKPRDKGLRQDKAILAEIVRLGFDPKSLPKNPPGKPDIKSTVGEAIATHPLFPSYDRYEKRWDLLRRQKIIVDRADPPPPKKS